MPLITMLTLLTGTFVGAFLTQVAKSFFDRLWESDSCIRYFVEKEMDSMELIELVDGDYVPHDDLKEGIVDSIIGDRFGVFVFAAPAGSGKSTYIRMAMRDLKSRCSKFKFKVIQEGNDVFQNKNLHEHLKIPQLKSFSDILPRHSIIIIDQIDLKMRLTDDIQAYLTDFAADSVNSGIYKIIVCVSDAYLANDILECNNYQKFQRLCAPKILQWSDEQVEKFMNLKNISSEVRGRLRTLASKCKNSPGLFHLAAESALDDELGWISLNEYACCTKRSWKEFDDVEKEVNKRLKLRRSKF